MLAGNTIKLIMPETVIASKPIISFSFSMREKMHRLGSRHHNAEWASKPPTTISMWEYFDLITRRNETFPTSKQSAQSLPVWCVTIQSTWRTLHKFRPGEFPCIFSPTKHRNKYTWCVMRCKHLHSRAMFQLTVWAMLTNKFARESADVVTSVRRMLVKCESA